MRAPISAEAQKQANARLLKLLNKEKQRTAEIMRRLEASRRSVALLQARRDPRVEKLADLVQEAFLEGWHCGHGAPMFATPGESYGDSGSLASLKALLED